MLEKKVIDKVNIAQDGQLILKKSSFIAKLRGNVHCWTVLYFFLMQNQFSLPGLRVHKNFVSKQGGIDYDVWVQPKIIKHSSVRMIN